jgi:homoserine kinase type II
MDAQSSTVTMLWESTDPHEALTKRFGFRDAPEAAEWIAEVLAQHWDLDLTSCGRLVISDHNILAWIEADRRRLIMKWSALPRRFAHVRQAAGLVAWLDTTEIPVVAPIPAVDGELLVELGNPSEGRARTRLPLPGSRFLIGLLPVASGELLSVQDPTQVEAAGQMLATLHETLAGYPDRPRGRARRRGAQLVHNDFRSANLLHDGDGICAVLDFEEIEQDTRTADLGKAAVLLATQHRDWGPTSALVRAAFVDAYDPHAQEPLTAAERRALDDAVAKHLHAFGWA